MKNRINQGKAGVVKPGATKCNETPANATKAETTVRFLVNRMRSSFMNINYRRKSLMAEYIAVETERIEKIRVKTGNLRSSH